MLNDNKYQTVYNVWKRADELFPAEDSAKQILFMLSREGLAGFIRIVKGDEGFTRNTIKKFYIPPNIVMKCWVIELYLLELKI